MIYKGFMYVQLNENEHSVRWECVEKLVNCKGCVETYFGEKPPHVLTDHNHPPNFKTGEEDTPLPNKSISRPLSGSDWSAYIEITTEGDEENVNNVSLLVNTCSLAQKSSTETNSVNSSVERNVHTIVRKGTNDLIKPSDAKSSSACCDSTPQTSQCKPQSELLQPGTFNINWFKHCKNMRTSFPISLNNERFVDITLASEGQSIKCHKLILSASSTYFEELLATTTCRHPIMLFANTSFWPLKALVDFMYHGTVTVPTKKMPDFLQLAETLQIKGLDTSKYHHVNKDINTNKTRISELNPVNNNGYEGIQKQNSIHVESKVQSISKEIGNQTYPTTVNENVEICQQQTELNLIKSLNRKRENDLVVSEGSKKIKLINPFHFRLYSFLKKSKLSDIPKTD